ncbi:MAG: 4-hydroxy-3-methylbut-2-enyl diphosphate reductase [Candidatus Scatovivens sp.]
MEMIIGKTAGFCFGVKNAVEKTTEQLINNNKEIYCLGELVHNRQVVEKLEKLGLKVVSLIDEIPNPKGKTVITRAHGITKDIYKKIKQLDINLIDLTCPKVLQIHKTVEEYSNRGYFVIYIGEKGHPESIGTVSFGEKKICVIEKEEEIKLNIEKIKKEKISKILVIAQTTFNLEKFNKFSETIKNTLNKDTLVEIKNTICNATRLRQEETKEISRNVDCMIIIGGKNSSNTKKLYEISCENCKKVYKVENKDEIIDYLSEIKQYNRIGIMAGASTPEETIEEVKKYLKS